MAQIRRLPPSLTTKTTLFSTLAVFGIGVYCARSYLLPQAHAESDESPVMFSGFGFTTLRVQSVKAVNHNTKRLVFEFPDKNARSGLSLTSALLTLSRPTGRWLPVIRPYTPIGDLNQQGSLELMVKQYPNGKASTHIHSLVPGDTLTFLTALKGFSWVPNQYPQIYAIAGGAGITPIYQLIRGILDNPNDKTKIKLVFGVNSEQDLLLREELEEYKKRFPERFEYVYTVSRLDGEKEGLRKGYVTEELLKGVVGGKGEGAKVFVCGPPAMEESLVGKSGILSRLGFEKGQVYKF
ncbi:hypothetical protein BDV32DRAFT_123960 [Aspergillus pseudonomiae]|uniref:NADH-cytochrome b5 reductase n=1 Tax=Aspergillus pseudonomiae TaxID=1506151 RepID=A0A5N7DJN8_9EURO|nr:uncharacterized protein BDV37DRAFT_58192 [Aspergillus pseudonomiae]KAB8259705.1 hypothetical protein BDV32DRAFT_123960 [Aspergillus pseudonomiae]KAE8406564.1 hypothetical protein BDV37DRAFT_58192 [Aspergillus pseudonomiae]